MVERMLLCWAERGSGEIWVGDADAGAGSGLMEGGWGKGGGVEWRGGNGEVGQWTGMVVVGGGCV